jgi:hypothetical protein
LDGGIPIKNINIKKPSAIFTDGLIFSYPRWSQTQAAAARSLLMVNTCHSTTPTQAKNIAINSRPGSQVAATRNLTLVPIP